jgi:hypothetical protein
MKAIDVPCDHKPSYIYYDSTVFEFIKRWFLPNFPCLKGPSFFLQGDCVSGAEAELES